MRRSDIYLADLEPVKGSEANKVRPVLIVSSDNLNEVVSKSRRGVVTIVPITTNTEYIWPFQVFLPAEVVGLQSDSKAQVEQVRALAVERFSPNLIGTLPNNYMDEVNEALKLHFDLRLN